jgi:hypothetical protein
VKKEITYDVTAEVTFEIADGVDIAFYVDNGERTHRMTGIYPDVVTEEQLLKHLAYNAIFNGVTDANRLDGWADLERGQITMHVTGSIE